MTNLQRRIERLERPAGAGAQAGLRLIVMDAGATFAMDVIGAWKSSPSPDLSGRVAAFSISRIFPTG
jgi:hypothetical protein